MTFLFSYLIYAQIPDNPGVFIISAEHLSSFADYSVNSNVPHSTAYWDTVKSFGLNYGGILYRQKYGTGGYIDVSKIQTDLTRANNEGIKTFLWNGFDGDIAAEERKNNAGRWVYQVEGNYDWCWYFATRSRPRC